MAVHVARCASCMAELTIQVVVDLSDIEARLGQIEASLATQGARMTNIDDELGTLETDVQALSDDEARELADLEALKSAGQALTPEQQARFDALDAKIKADTAAIDQADPPAAPAEPVPAPETPTA